MRLELRHIRATRALPSHAYVRQPASSLLNLIYIITYYYCSAGPC